MSKKYNWTNEEINMIIHKYCVLKESLNNIAKELKHGRKSIRNVLIDNHINIRTTKETSKRCNIDENYFENIDTSEKAYWLGFLYADGCVRKCGLSVKLHIRDKNHLQKLSECLQSTYKISEFINNNGYAIGNKYCNISISNKKISDDLIDKGCFINKSKILQFPNENILPSYLISHFIRGYFDGDGSVYETMIKKYNYLHAFVNFTGTYDMLYNIRNYILPTSRTKVRIYKNKNIYDLKLGGKNQFIKMYYYLYDDATIYLDRKKEKFKSILANIGFTPYEAMLNTLNDPKYDCIKIS